MGTIVPLDIAASVHAALMAELGIDADAVAGDGELLLLPGMESVKLLRIVSVLEEEHGVSLDDDALFAVETVDDLIRALRGGQAEAEPAEEAGP